MTRPPGNSSALLYIEQRKTPDAISPPLQEAIALDYPIRRSVQQSSAGFGTRREIRAGRTSHCEMQFELSPIYAEAHNNLGSLLSSTGHFDEAKYHFRSSASIQTRLQLCAVQLRDRAGAARAVWMRRKRQIETLLRSRSECRGEAHEFLGTLLDGARTIEGAIEQYRERSEFDPISAAPQVNLGNALSESGDITAAMPYLQKAAQSSRFMTIKEEAGTYATKTRKQ